MSEQWRPAPSYSDYEVSDLGRIRNAITGRVLSPFRGNKGYPAIKLVRDGKRHTVIVHRLIARAFHGERPFDGAEVRHLDGVNTHNSASNLKWGTRSENALDAVGHGSHVDTRKTHCPHGHEYTPENTYLQRNSRTGGSSRVCRTCLRDRDRAKRLRRAASR